MCSSDLGCSTTLVIRCRAPLSSGAHPFSAWTASCHVESEDHPRIDVTATDAQCLACWGKPRAQRPWPSTSASAVPPKQPGSGTRAMWSSGRKQLLRGRCQVREAPVAARRNGKLMRGAMFAPHGLDLVEGNQRSPLDPSKPSPRLARQKRANGNPEGASQALSLVLRPPVCTVA